ncbi:hypothetical protein CV102_17260 [Natronococcus pandeyae]|uniref:Uncharacterized protein n=1 Tax=Natronococcus pandeyae TaxID=2055836 RepID=A0A8J8Q2R3_9EURY|nr:hypothetical protein CV102_17260 [Natronococcus pandeyae]
MKMWTFHGKIKQKDGYQSGLNDIMQMCIGRRKTTLRAVISSKPLVQQNRTFWSRILTWEY